MSPPILCAAAGCDNPVTRRPDHRGRPPIYCSPACRSSRTRRPAVTVEITHDDTSQQPGRDWVVQLRRGTRTVVVRQGLGRFSATAFAAELRTLLPTTAIRDVTP